VLATPGAEKRIGRQGILSTTGNSKFPCGAVGEVEGMPFLVVRRKPAALATTIPKVDPPPEAQPSGIEDAFNFALASFITLIRPREWPLRLFQGKARRASFEVLGKFCKQGDAAGVGGVIPMVVSEASCPRRGANDALLNTDNTSAGSSIIRAHHNSRRRLLRAFPRARGG